MKKLFSILVLALLVGFTATAQRTITADTLTKVETINFASMQGAETVTAICTNVGGTSDGTLTLYGSIDNTNWVFLNFVGGVLGTASPKASITGADLNQITITGGLVASWTDLGEYPYYRVTAVGTANDTTAVQVIWRK